MIPKIVHYSWFSGEAFPADVAGYVARWRELLPGYELRLWDMERLMAELGDVPFVREALSQRKWAFAADYLRLYALEKYGGIWLDTDVELLKGVDGFLGDGCFIGKESWVNHEGRVYVTSHFMGAEAGHEFIRECLDFYRDRHFILGENEDGNVRLDQTMISQIQAEIAQRHGLDMRAENKDRAQVLDNGVKVYPSYYFCRPMYKPLKKVYGIHRVKGAWREGKQVDGKSMTDPKKLTLRIILWRLLHSVGLK